MAGTSLGTAWIQIKPSMTGITSSLRSELSKVGEEEGGEVGVKFGAGFVAKLAIIQTAAKKVFSKVASTITNQLGDAIYRADTLNRFPKVMEMMGYSAEDAASAIEKLRNGVKGIPTSLADVVSGTQRIAAITGNVDKAAAWALAISDAMLITTGDVNEASRGMQQFLQVLARGKPAGDDWNTVMEVASPIMNELARSLGYASASLGGDFYTALQNGTLSTEQMMDALVNLDQNGGSGLESLHARVETSTGGIEAAMTNLRQSISNALVDIIQEIGSENIESVIEAVRDALVEVVKVLKGVIVFVKENWDWLKYVFGTIATFFAGATILNGIAKITKSVGSFSRTLGGIFGKGTSETITRSAESSFGGLGETISGILESLKKVLASAVQAIIEPIKALLKGVGEALAGFFSALANPSVAIGAAMFAAVAAAIAAAILLIGGAIGIVAPGIGAFVDVVVIPLGEFLRDTFLVVLDATTDAIIRLTNEALIPLGEFLSNALLSYIDTMTDSIIRVTNEAIIPLMNVLGGTFINVLTTVSDLITGTLSVALEGIRGIIDSVGDGFTKMGDAIKTALEGAQGVLSVFADMLASISEAIVAIVALVTGQSVVYGAGFAKVTKAATGGLIMGPGTETSDSIPALLSKGEYVVKASSAKKIGYDNLERMNRDGEISASTQNNYFTINGYNKSPKELATEVSNILALRQKGVIG